MLGFLIKPLITLGTKLLVTIGSTQVLEWAFFTVAEAIVKSTKTPHDDNFLKMVKGIYKSPPPPPVNK